MKTFSIGKRALAAVLAVLMLTAAVLTSCTTENADGGNDAPPAVFDPNAEVDYYEWTKDKFTDSSQLTSWADMGQERQLTLTAWNTLQTGGYKKVTASNDVVYPEIQRITGVTLNTSKSFDNGGMSADAAYQRLQLTGLPHIAYGNWVDPDAVYDLTDLIKEYCPTIYSRMPESVWNSPNINGGKDGKVYAIPYGIGDVDLSSVDPEADRDSCLMFNGQTDYYPYILVREDILLDAYPDALSSEDIAAIFAENGSFTEEQLFDIEITSADEFRNEFLPAIYNAIRTTKNDDGSYKYQINKDRWVEVTTCGYGSDGDTWDFMGSLLPKLLGATGCGLNTQQTYWDATEKEVQLLMKEDFYVAELKEWSNLIANGKYITQDGIIKTKQQIKESYNNGYYAIGYGSTTKPDGDKARLADGTTVNYRRVYLKIEKRDNFEFLNIEQPSINGICIFKDTVNEEDLPQILRWLDFQCSELCDKLVAWGPENAGLFTEDENGVRQFKDEKLVEQMVFSTVTLGTEVQKYNLHNAMAEAPNKVFTFFYQGGSKDHPKAVYDLSALADLVNTAYSSAAVFSDKEPVGIAKDASIWKWTNADLEGVEAIWAKRPMVEKALFQVLSAGSNFDAKWADALKAMDQAGWTDEYFATIYTEAFLTLNEDFVDELLD